MYENYDAYDNNTVFYQLPHFMLLQTNIVDNLA